MIKRIVKLTFRPEEVDTFMAIFEAKKVAIRTFPGCLHLELWRNLEPDNIFFTYCLVGCRPVPGDACLFSACRDSPNQYLYG